MSVIRVGIVGDRVDGEWCSPSFQLRFLYPWADIPSIKLRLIRNPSDIENLDYVVFQRLSGVDEVGEQIFEEALKKRIPRILDIDDDFHAVSSTDNHEGKVWTANVIQKYEDSLSKFSQIWVSTEALGAKINTYSGMTFRVRPTVPPRLIGSQVNYRDVRLRCRSLLYFGTATHLGDFELVRQVLEREVEEEKIHATVVGLPINETTKAAIAAVTVSRKIATRYTSFMDYLDRLGPFDVGIAPLLKNEVNQSKSGLKVMEYAALGILPLASDCEAYSWLNQLGLGTLLVSPGLDNWSEKISQISELNHKSFEELRMSTSLTINHFSENLRQWNLSGDLDSLNNG